MSNTFTNTVHFVLQGKGGIGKSFISSLIAQYIQQESDAVCFDTDQVNTTFAHYKAFNATHIKVTDDNGLLDTIGFDALIEKIVETDKPVIIDNGANTFQPLTSYMVENDVFNLLLESGKAVFIHSIVGGGDNITDSANGFYSVLNTEGANVVLWLNEHFGSTDIQGKDFTEMKAVQEDDKIAGVVRLVARNPQTYGVDVKKMTGERLTFDEVMKKPKEFGLMSRQRLTQIKKDVFGQLDNVFFEVEEEKELTSEQ